MLVKSHKQKFLPCLLLGVCGAVLAADNELPDGEFLEYLGSWEKSDEEWLMFNQDAKQVTADSDARVEPAPRGKESTENDDES